MKNTSLPFKANVTYTMAKANSDLLKLLPYLQPFFDKHDILNTCAACLAPLPSEGIRRVVIDDQTGNVAMFCNQCLPSAKFHKKASCHAMPKSVEKRITLIHSLRLEAVNIVATQTGFPVVTKPLLCDSPRHKAILFTEDKAFSAFVPWLDSDRLIVGGQLAKDALAIYKSIKAGKTDLRWLGVNPLLATTDKNLWHESAQENNNDQS